jgi:hypothetical protein
VHRSYEVDPKEESVVFRTEFVGVERPHGTVRIGHVALHPETLGPHVFYRVTNGGPTPETFPLTVGFMHHEPVSTMVSCRSGLGATEGFVELGNATMGIRAQWDPAQCAAMPVVDFKPCPPSALTRLIFSLCELDETSKPGGGLLPFSFKLSPTQGMGAVHPCQGTRQGKDVTQEEAHGLGDDGPARIDARRTKARP